jgi:hypothetical protein
MIGWSKFNERLLDVSASLKEKMQKRLQVYHPKKKLLQCNLSHPTHLGTREMCRIAQDVGKLRFSF